MKTLTTFIWGLILFLSGFCVIIKHFDFDSFWDYVWIIVGAFATWQGLSKIDKSTD